ncbi:MAG: PHP domain-containing protein [Bacteroidetes bacterium]|nr:PHP domain-containing protein [Bacteroidota bacterium]
MNTEELAASLKLTSQLMEMHGENPFKVKALSNAAYRLDKTGVDLERKSLEELEAVEGVGKGIAAKIFELNTTGTTKELQHYLEKTPHGVIEMLSVKGIGPKKVAQLWKELGVESPGELLYACKENRLVDLKGFGEKTQDSVMKAIEYMMANKGKFHFYKVEKFAEDTVEFLKEKLETENISVTGAVRRKELVIDKIEIVAAVEEDAIDLSELENPMNIPVEIHSCDPADFYSALFHTTASESHLKQLEELKRNSLDESSEEKIYKSYGLDYIEPELREGNGEILLAKNHKLPALIEVSDLKGNLHNHSKYSDGMNTLKEMAEACRKYGFEYFGICDHSKSAFYANGLQPDRIERQHEEIEILNEKMAPFKIFKGIESDILNDGSLDYEENILKTFDFIVASVHSNLKMEKEKATQRLLKAIENPFTRILGHPTGRLLLSREGYPIDHKKIIDACAANNVAIELNAHPYRLDIDWKWIPYCMEKNVLISINPDAHETEGLLDVKWGTIAARKGMLTKEFCLNAMNLSQFEKWLSSK